MSEYLATWLGVVTGSTAGRNDGYPEEKSKVISVKDIPRYERLAEFKLYALREILPEDIKSISEEVQRKQKTDAYEKQQAKFRVLSKLSPADKKILGL